MATISSLGIGSGVLTSSLIDQLVTAEQKPQSDQLTQQQTKISNKASEFAKIQDAVTSLRLPARTLTESGALVSYNVSSSASGISGSVTDNSSVQPGQYSVQVSNIATAQSLATGTLPDQNSTTLGTGQLTIQVGSKSTTLTVDNTDNTLQGLAKKINSSNVGATATVVNTGAGYRLVLTSQQTGTANAIKISVQDSDGNNTDNSGLSQLAYDGTTNNLTQTVAASDAHFSVNGISVTQSSNTAKNVIPGVSLNLTAATSGPALVTIGQDTSTATKRVQDFVDAYNKVQSLIANDTKYDPTSQTGGVFLGDSTVNSIMSQLRNTISQIVPGLQSASVRSLSEIGISTDPQTGQLKFDQTKFQAALSANPQDVAAIFGDQGRTTDAQVQFLTGSVDSKAGTYSINVAQAATQGAYNGSVAISTSANVSISSSNDTFSIKVDGSTTANIKLTDGSYTRAQLISEIQTELNSSSALQSANLQVTAGLDSSNHLTLTSGTYGSKSEVDITSAGSTSSSTLGLSVGNGTAGLDVSGTINGEAATGNGQVLTGTTGNAKGVAVNISGSTTGSRGTVTYIRGVGDQMVNLINGFLGTSGIITDKNNLFQKQLSDITQQQTDLTNRMDQYRKQLQQQFTSADSQVAQYNSTMSFLTAQLGALSGGTSTPKAKTSGG